MFVIRILSQIKARNKLMIAVAGIVLLAAPLRMYGLNTHPPGLFGDEAAEGLDALRIIGGERPLYLIDNNGREAMHAYLVAASIQLLGRTPIAVRLPSAIASTLTTLGILLVAHSLFGPHIALITGFICAVTVWPIMLGRLATRPALLPLFLSFSLWMAVEAWRRGGVWRWIISGLVFGAAFYTYTPIRVMFLAPLLCAVITFGIYRKTFPWLGALYFSSALLLTVSPLAIFTFNHRDIVFGRSAGVAVVSLADDPQKIAYKLVDQVASVLPMFIVPGRGDWNLRHNIPNRAALDPSISIALTVGILLAVKRKYRRYIIILIVWIAVALLPTILSEEAPHFARSSGALPVLFIIPAIGISYIYRSVYHFRTKYTAIIISAGLLLASIFLTTRDFYIKNYLGTPNAGFWFDEPCTIAAIDTNRFFGSGWQGHNAVIPKSSINTQRQVLIAPQVCPKYSSSGFYTIQFLVPQELGKSNNFQRYNLDVLPPLSSLNHELLILAVPGDEEYLLPWLAETYSTTTVDGPWTAPDKLGNSWLVYRQIHAISK